MSRTTDSCGNRFPRGRCAGIAFILALVLTAPSRGTAQSEDQIKAAFLLNFARYVEWPQASFGSIDAPIQICTVDDTAFDSVLGKTIAGKTVGSRRLENRPLDLEVLRVAATCHILFVGPSNSAAASATALGFEGASVFTIANDEGYAAQGGVANFFRAGNKIRFAINPKASSKAGLKISSRLLRLARIVE